MSMYSTIYQNPSRIVTGTPVLNNDDVVLYCNTSTGAVTINLLDIPNNYWLTTWKLYVVDYSNNAATNNITINAGTGQTINAQSSININTNGGSAIVRISGNTTFVCEPIASTLNDTGWVNLKGFGHIPDGNSRFPQFRVYGKQVYFRGTAIIPLSSVANGSTQVIMTDSGIGAYYVNQPYPYVYQGTDGCVLDANGSLAFNQGYSIFPPSYNVPIDKMYQTGFQIASRVVATNNANSAVALSSIFNVYITPSGVLNVQTYKDVELNPYVPNPTNGLGSGGARQLISRVQRGEYVVNWKTQANGWTQSSILNTGNTRNWTIPSATNTFLFSCDPAEETDIGGFQINLDGLIAFTS